MDYVQWSGTALIVERRLACIDRKHERFVFAVFQIFGQVIASVDPLRPVSGLKTFLFYRIKVILNHTSTLLYHLHEAWFKIMTT